MSKPFFIISLFSIAFVGNTDHQTIIMPGGMEMEHVLNQLAIKKDKQEVEFAFDIHKVLLQKNTKSILKTIINSRYKWQLFGVLISPGLLFGLSKMAYQALINTMPWASQKYRELTAEELVCLVREYGNEELLALTIDIVNTQQVDPDVKEIVVNLKNLGYPLRIASNIGKDIYIKLKQQLESSKANIFALFEQDEDGMEGKTIDYRVSPVQKPDLSFFQEFLDAYDPERKKLFIFIDDKLINVKAASQKGFVGIHFKNAQQLNDDLQRLQLL